MLIPFRRGSASARQKVKRVGTAALALFLIKGLVWLVIAGMAFWR